MELLFLEMLFKSQPWNYIEVTDSVFALPSSVIQPWLCMSPLISIPFAAASFLLCAKWPFHLKRDTGIDEKTLAVFALLHLALREDMLFSF